MLTNCLNLVVLLSLLLTYSCASILSGTTETIYVKSNVPGTSLYLDQTFIGVDEGSIKVSKKRLKKVQLRAVKAGCETNTSNIETQFDKTTLLGLLLDLGVVSILIVDWGTYGAVRKAGKLNYVLSPVCQNPAQTVF